MQGVCDRDGCAKQAKHRGFCRRHYIEDQYRDTPVPTDAVLAGRLFPKIAENSVTGCWEWSGAKQSRTSHGMFGYNALGRNVTRYVHTWMWEFLVGPVPDGLVLDHLCRVTHCCNPAHLEPVPVGMNTLRGDGPTAVNARKTHCKRGHALAGQNLIVRPGKSGPQRQCRECANMTRRRRSAEIKSVK